MGRQYDVNNEQKSSRVEKSNRAILAYAISGILGIAFAVFVHLEFQDSQSPKVAFDSENQSEDDPHAIFISKGKKSNRTPSAVEEKPAYEREVAADRKLLEEPVWKSANATGPSKMTKNHMTCSVSESKGTLEQFTAEEQDWRWVVESFDKAKQRIRSWARMNRHQFSKIELEELYASLKHAALERPPYEDEPDMSWRGVVTWRYDVVNHKPKIRVGGGFFKKLKSDPNFAQFELTRALAMSWNPCQMKKKGYPRVWGGLLQCLGMGSALSCEGNQFSMENWAVATVVAAEVSHPGCAIPAFVSAKQDKCLNKIKLKETNRKTASNHE